MKHDALKTEIGDIKSNHEVLRDETQRQLNNIVPDLQTLFKNLANIDSIATENNKQILNLQNVVLVLSKEKE